MHNGHGARDNSVHAPILVVEDQDDVRQMLCTTLHVEGYRTLSASSAAEGLECLRRHRVGLVITDYAMPGGTGTWMLHEAKALGLLDGVPALVVTATPDVASMEGPFAVIEKPLDLDAFLEQVQRLLESAPGLEDGPGTSAMEQHKIHLVLYVSAYTPSSMRAQRVLYRTLERYELGQVRLSVHDLTRDPLAGADDRIVYTPTLVKRWPSPAVWIVGSLEDEDVLRELLVGCGVERRAIRPDRRLH